jgi:hypothetical protein
MEGCVRRSLNFSLSFADIHMRAGERESVKEEREKGVCVFQLILLGGKCLIQLWEVGIEN